MSGFCSTLTETGVDELNSFFTSSTRRSSLKRMERIWSGGVEKEERSKTKYRITGN